MNLLYKNSIQYHVIFKNVEDFEKLVIKFVYNCKFSNKFFLFDNHKINQHNKSLKKILQMKIWKRISNLPYFLLRVFAFQICPSK